MPGAADGVVDQADAGSRISASRQIHPVVGSACDCGAADADVAAAVGLDALVATIDAAAADGDRGARGDDAAAWEAADRGVLHHQPEALGLQAAGRATGDVDAVVGVPDGGPVDGPVAAGAADPEAAPVAGLWGAAVGVVDVGRSAGRHRRLGRLVGEAGEGRPARARVQRAAVQVDGSTSHHQRVGRHPESERTRHRQVALQQVAERVLGSSVVGRDPVQIAAHRTAEDDGVQPVAAALVAAHPGRHVQAALVEPHRRKGQLVDVVGGEPVAAQRVPAHRRVLRVVDHDALVPGAADGVVDQADRRGGGPAARQVHAVVGSAGDGGVGDRHVTGSVRVDPLVARRDAGAGDGDGTAAGADAAARKVRNHEIAEIDARTAVCIDAVTSFVDPDVGHVERRPRIQPDTCPGTLRCIRIGGCEGGIVVPACSRRLEFSAVKVDAAAP